MIAREAIRNVAIARMNTVTVSARRSATMEPNTDVNWAFCRAPNSAEAWKDKIYRICAEYAVYQRMHGWIHTDGPQLQTPAVGTAHE